MALSTAADYKTAIFRVLKTLPRDLDKETWIRIGGMARADATQLMSEFDTWRLAQGSRIHQTHKHDAT